MATNRLDAIDPAIRRRAALVLEFSRPNPEQRSLLFAGFFPHATPLEISSLVSATSGKIGGVGFTYSDITQRLLPRAILDAYNRSTQLDIALVLSVAKYTEATPPFVSVG